MLHARIWASALIVGLVVGLTGAMEGNWDAAAVAQSRAPSRTFGSHGWSKPSACPASWVSTLRAYR